MKILIVDDSPTALLHSQLYLEEAAARYGRTIHILTAPDGEKALEIINRQLPDLIILDIQLPGMNGFEVCSQIKSGSTEARVAFVSGTLNEEILRQAKLSRGNYFIKKPISPDSFNDILAPQDHQQASEEQSKHEH